MTTAATAVLRERSHHPRRWVIVDGTRPEDEVAAAIWEIIAIRFPDLA